MKIQQHIHCEKVLNGLDLSKLIEAIKTERQLRASLKAKVLLEQPQVQKKKYKLQQPLTLDREVLSENSEVKTFRSESKVVIIKQIIDKISTRIKINEQSQKPTQQLSKKLSVFQKIQQKYTQISQKSKCAKQISKEMFELVSIITSYTTAQQVVYLWKVQNLRIWYTLGEASEQLFKLLLKKYKKIKHQVSQFIPKEKSVLSNPFKKLDLSKHRYASYFKNKQNIQFQKQIFNRVLVSKVSRFQSQNFKKVNQNRRKNEQQCAVQDEYLPTPEQIKEYLKQFLNQLQQGDLLKNQTTFCKLQEPHRIKKYKKLMKEFYYKKQAIHSTHKYSTKTIRHELNQKLIQLKSCFDAQAKIKDIIMLINLKLKTLSCLDGKSLGLRSSTKEMIYNYTISADMQEQVFQN